MPRVEIVNLGAWSRGAGLLAEYDAAADTIRVHARAVERVREMLGDREASRFVACAVAHELYHRAHAGSSEEAAHAAAQVACGVDPRRYEAFLRARA